MSRSSIRSHRFSPTCVSILGLLLLLSGLSFTQTNTSISGVVRDQQDKVVPGSSVTLINPATGVVRTQKTNQTGNYSFDLLTPGDYRLEVQASGFRKSVIENVHALIAKPVDLDVKLQVGASAEEITVSAEGSQALVNTQDASVGNNFIAKQITQLPLESRNVLSLLSLQPGVTKDGYVAGARADQSNVTLDGIDINEAQSSAISGAQTYTDTPQAEKGPVIRLNAEAVEEFRVATATGNATGGRSSGAQIALVTRSGTNTFHGAAFEQHRNTIFTANDYFSNNSGLDRTKLIRNTFGGAIGGPIVKNKLFFFYSYEGRRDASAALVNNSIIVPFSHVGLGQVKYHLCADAACSGSGQLVTLNATDLNTIFPDVGLNPAALQALSQAAAQYSPNDFSVGDGMNTGGFIFNNPKPVGLNSHSAKIDLNLNSHQTLYVRGNVIYDKVGGNPRFPGGTKPDEWDHPTAYAIGHTWTIGNNIVNNARFGLTRQAFTLGGDNLGNSTRFRFIYQPANNSRTLFRKTPVYNWADDVSWVRGRHTIQFGANIVKQNNIRISYANAFDDAVTNPSFYATGAIRGPLQNYTLQKFGLPMYSGDGSSAENVVTALIGRLNQYTANFTYGSDLNLLPAGTPSTRNFAGQGYEGYIQDVWKMRPSLTITAGLRYSLWRPIYEVNGFEAKPNIPLGTYLERRATGAAAGQAYAEPISVELAGPANNAPNMYHWDKKNIQPRVAFAWSPRFDDGLLSRIFGKENQGVIRAGASINGDYFGQALAAFFDQENTLGFGSSTTISANTYNVGCSPYATIARFIGSAGACSGYDPTKFAPLFTGFGQNVRTLPNITVQNNIAFPQMQPADDSPRIEASLDENLTTPKSYAWSLTFERQLPKGLLVQASYIGRMGRHLLLQRDVMALLNLVDPASKTDWYTAGTMLAKLREQHVPASQVQAIPYFENLFPNLVTSLNNAYDYGYPANFTSTQAAYQDLLDYGGDFTTMQLDIDTFSKVGPNAFYNPQYGALTAFSTEGNSSYNAFTLSVRERLSSLTLDFNYSYSHSIDDASGLQSAASYDGTSFILNPFRQRDNRASSDFDMRHQININSVWQLPFGRSRTFFSGAGKIANGFIGGWQLSNIFRWNTGMPIGFYDAPGVFDDARWATNWEVQSNGVPIKPISTCPTRGSDPKLFGCNTAEAFKSFRNPYPGETGPRNLFRVPGFVTLDFGLGKTFNLSGLSQKIPEGHQLQFRWEVFNATNTQRFGNFDGSRSGFGIPLDPAENDPPSNWSNFRAIQGSPRVMQFALRYSF